MEKNYQKNWYFSYKIDKVINSKGVPALKNNVLITWLNYSFTISY